MPQGPTAWIVSHRPAKLPVDAGRPVGFFLEREPSDAGRVVHSLCLLLTNKECPWRCLMCDLWLHTLDGPTPPGAVGRQLDYTLAKVELRPEQVKLYNSGSFFDVAAIPPQDYGGIAGRLGFARRVVVESHPRLVGARTLRFRDLLRGSLEVAMGLETTHPRILPRLNKRFDLDQFARAADFLRRQGVTLRVFILVKPPFLDDREAVEWATRSAAFAYACGARLVSLIPVRPGNGALDRLMESGKFAPPTPSLLEEALVSVLALRKGVAVADTWDCERFSTCPVCLEQRKRRLLWMNSRQQALPPYQCPRCAR